MKHIESLVEYINQALNEPEKEYLIELLTIPDSSKESHEAAENENSLSPEKPFSTEKQPHNPVIEEFYTQNRRVIKFSVIKKKLMIQKPKTLVKLKNVVKQIGESEGGFSDLTINLVVEALVQDKVLITDISDNLEWLK